MTYLCDFTYNLIVLATSCVCISKTATTEYCCRTPNRNLKTLAYIPFLFHIAHLPRGLLSHDTNPRPTGFCYESRQAARDERTAPRKQTADG